LLIRVLSFIRRKVLRDAVVWKKNKKEMGGKKRRTQISHSRREKGNRGVPPPKKENSLEGLKRKGP